MLREALTLESVRKLPPAEAAALFVARRAEGLTAQEESLLSDWLSDDPSHRRHLEAAERAWRSVDDGEGNEILTAMREHARAVRRQPPRWRPIAAGAALVAAMCALVVLFVPGLSPWGSAGETFQYVTARGEVRAVTLTDGTVITLDADSAVSGEFRRDERSLRLDRGRALFAVARDPSRPFVVSVGDRQITALGTRFDANLIGDDLVVTLVEGRVSIERRGDRSPVLLEGGQQYLERAGAVTVRTLGDATEAMTSWREGLITFDDQPLAEAVTIMNRYSEEQIGLGDSTLEAIRVSGQFRAGETRRFAETLAEIHALELVDRQSQIELVRRE